MKKMLTTNELSERWSVHPDTIKRYRREGSGPQYIKLGSLAKSPILYRLEDVLEYEDEHMVRVEEVSGE